VTEKSSNVTEDSSSVTVTERDTLARARPSYEGMSRCHAVTNSGRDVTLQRDSDMPGPEGRDVTITQSTSKVRRQKDRDRLAADPRFAAWVAGQ
jgi:hypothetical protein